MNNDEMNRAIAEACGFKPEKRWKVMYADEPTSGMVDFRSRAEAQEAKTRAEIQQKSLPPIYHLKYSEPEEYDSWDKAPRYTACLNACHEAKRQLLTTPELCDTFNRMLMEEKPSRPVEFETDKWTWGQSAEVEARALLRTLTLYQDTLES